MGQALAEMWTKKGQTLQMARQQESQKGHIIIKLYVKFYSPLLITLNPLMCLCDWLLSMVQKLY